MLWGYKIPYLTDEGFCGFGDYLLNMKKVDKNSYENEVKIYKFSGELVEKKEDDCQEVFYDYYVVGDVIYQKRKPVSLTERELLQPETIFYLKSMKDYDYVFFENKFLAILSKCLFFDALEKGKLDLLYLDDYEFFEGEFDNYDLVLKMLPSNYKEYLKKYKKKYIHLIV